MDQKYFLKQTLKLLQKKKSIDFRIFEGIKETKIYNLTQQKI